MMNKTLNIKLLVLALLSGCASRQLNPEEQISASEELAPPQDTSINVNCNLENDPMGAADSELKFRGKSVKYFDSSEIPYHSERWWKRDQQWISFSSLDSSILGFPGFDGRQSGRTFSVTSAVNARVTAIDIRKINGKLKYHYYSNETGDNPIENWSSTKSLAMTMAAHAIRNKSDFSHGMSSIISSTGAPLSSAVTEVARTSNNRTAVWFKSFVGAQGSDFFIQNWIGGGQDSRFGGSHGESPQAWGNELLSQNVKKQFPGAGSFASTSNNTLMPIIMAEYWKRMGVNTQDKRTFLKKGVKYFDGTMSEQKRLEALSSSAEPGITEQDLAVLLYGKPTGNSFGGLLLGGANNDGFVNALGGKSNLDSKFGGKWRFYGKTGTGSAVRSGRSRNEQVIGGFVCIPANRNNATLKHGRAFAFFINIQAAGDTSGPRAATLRALTAALVPEIKGNQNLWAE